MGYPEEMKSCKNHRVLVVIDPVGDRFMSRELGCRFGAVALLLGMALAACHSPPAPSAPVAAAQRPTVTAAATSRPVFSLIGEGSPAPVCAPLPASDLAPIEPSFQRFELPPGTPAIISVIGRDERDVWLLPSTEYSPEVLHWDGATLRKEPVSPCEIHLSHASLVFGPDGLILRTGSYEDSDITFREAHRSAGGSWRCDDRDRTTRPVPLGASVLRVPYGWPRLVLSGRRLPTPDPARTPGGNLDVVGRAGDDFWLYGDSDSVVLHYNGVTWEDRSPGFESVDHLGTDQSGDLWLLGRRVRKAPSDEEVLRWDREAHAWSCFPAPPGLHTMLLRVRNASDVWFLGEKEITHWNGAVLQRGPTPIKALRDAWIDARGELWIVGEEEDRTTQLRRGVVFRARSGDKP